MHAGDTQPSLTAAVGVRGRTRSARPTAGETEAGGAAWFVLRPWRRAGTHFRTESRVSGRILLRTQATRPRTWWWTERARDTRIAAHHLANCSMSGRARPSRRDARARGPHSLPRRSELPRTRAFVTACIFPSFVAHSTLVGLNGSSQRSLLAFLFLEPITGPAERDCPPCGRDVPLALPPFPSFHHPPPATPRSPPRLGRALPTVGSPDKTS